MAYHHGDLPAALLSAVGMIVNEEGIDALTLRAAARRAGVSHGAPAHHFGDKRGMLTAFAKQAAVHLERCVLDLLGPVPVDACARRLVAIGLGYLDYSMIHPAHFAVASRDELLDTSDVALISARLRVVRHLNTVLQRGVAQGQLDLAELPGVRLAFWALIVGLATVGSSLAEEPLTQGQQRVRAQDVLELFAQRLFRESSRNS